MYSLSYLTSISLVLPASPPSESQMTAWSSFLLNLAGSLAALILLYGLYFFCARLFARGKASLETWWLPAWRCFRLVIRNIPQGYALTDVRSRAWLRYLVPRRDGCSVNSFRDIELVRTDRIMISRKNDLPLICFRLTKGNGFLRFVVTDKFGSEIESHELSKEFKEFLIEYSAKVQTWNLIKYEIHRTYVIPYVHEGHGVFEGVFAKQAESEGPFPLILRAEVVRVSI